MRPSKPWLMATGPALSPTRMRKVTADVVPACTVKRIGIVQMAGYVELAVQRPLLLLAASVAAAIADGLPSRKRATVM